MKLLDEIGLRYAIVLNEFDKVAKEEQTEVQNPIQSEVENLGLKGVNNIFCQCQTTADVSRLDGYDQVS